MLLKLRRGRQIRRFRSAAEGSSNTWNTFINKDLVSHDTCSQGTSGLAPDVHPLSADNYRESTAVHKKVLIVDDSPAEIKLMQSLLEKEGYWPVGLNDPKRVEEAITHERPNVILLDIIMPDRNGFQVCRDLKGSSEFNSIPVIMVTSKDSASDKFWGQQQGADGYITKPFTRDELLRAVRRFA